MTDPRCFSVGFRGTSALFPLLRSRPRRARARARRGHANSRPAASRQRTKTGSRSPKLRPFVAPGGSRESMCHDTVELSATLSRQSHRRGGVSLDDGPVGSSEIRCPFNIKRSHTACPIKDQLRALKREVRREWQIPNG